MIGYWLVQFLTVTFVIGLVEQKKYSCNEKIDICIDEENWKYIIPNSTSDATSLFIEDKWNMIFFPFNR